MIWRKNPLTSVGDYPPAIQKKCIELGLIKDRKKRFTKADYIRKVRIPGTEDMAEYKDYLFHIRQSCIGMLLGLPACLLAGLLVMIF